MVLGRHGNGLEVGTLGGDPPFPTLVGGMVAFERADPRWHCRVVMWSAVTLFFFPVCSGRLAAVSSNGRWSAWEWSGGGRTWG